MKRLKWTEDMIVTLKDLYPTETIDTVASQLGVGKSSVKSKAVELGLEKGIKREWLEKAVEVRRLHPNHSISEISNLVGLSARSISRIISNLGLRREKADEKRIRSRVRTEIIKREKRRIIFGLSPITNIKVVTNKKKIAYRHKLKTIGCEVSRNATNIYYSSDAGLLPEHFEKSRMLGLRLLPLLN